MQSSLCRIITCDTEGGWCPLTPVLSGQSKTFWAVERGTAERGTAEKLLNEEKWNRCPLRLCRRNLRGDTPIITLRTSLGCGGASRPLGNVILLRFVAVVIVAGRARDDELVMIHVVYSVICVRI